MRVDQDAARWNPCHVQRQHVVAARVGGGRQQLGGAALRRLGMSRDSGVDGAEGYGVAGDDGARGGGDLEGQVGARERARRGADAAAGFRT